ncbi:hypothetical protein HELRODRAFT_169765 [Helobdella robusta]|uniref:RING-type domain-containing protein n=1 Tax=Helobdella robusta TaxID=6412 RepID=T1F2B2_HELRO|nr:hypothetical protein HELRODRAFT_169765 [Helobdella robusta]ESO08042.1 hypothetical protein HELRODRAFT_169765 [Helobdella robusta]
MDLKKKEFQRVAKLISMLNDDHNDRPMPQSSVLQRNIHVSYVVKFEERTMLHELSCGYVFHFQCSKLWLKEKASCPFCRKEVASAHVKDVVCKNLRDASRKRYMKLKLTTISNFNERF